MSRAPKCRLCGQVHWSSDECPKTSSPNDEVVELKQRVAALEEELAKYRGAEEERKAKAREKMKRWRQLQKGQF